MFKKHRLSSVMLKTVFKGLFNYKTYFIENLVLKQFVTFTATYAGAEDLHCLGLAEKFLV